MALHPWLETSTNKFEQKYGFMERFFVRFLGEEGVPSQFTIVAATTFRFTGASFDLEPRLRETWRAMRYHSPAIAALTDSEAKTYESPDEAALEEWEKLTFRVHPLGTTAETLFKSIQRTRMITVHFLPGGGGAKDAHQLVLQAEHHHIDGRGVYYFLNSFWIVFTDLQLRENILFGDEWSRLPGVMDDLLELPLSISEDEERIASEWIASMGAVKPISIPIAEDRRAKAPSCSMRAVVELSRETTSAVVAQCRARNLTVTSAWVAALTLAVAHFDRQTIGPGALDGGRGLDPSAGLATFATVDMRKFFPADFDPSDGPVACYHAAIPITLPAAESFDELASLARREFHGGNITPERARTWAPFIAMMGDAIAASNPLQSSLLVSSLGVEDDFLARLYGNGADSVELSDLWIADTMMSATSLWLSHTWRGKLTLSATYNEAYFSEEQMNGVLNRMKDELLEGLGVPQ